MSPTARWNGASGESKGLRRYDKENLLWQFTVATMSDPVGSVAVRPRNEFANDVCAGCRATVFRQDLHD